VYLNTILLHNFRNYEHLELSLSPRINFFVGHNAQGKTNFLEALTFLATGRSHRTHKDGEMIRWGQGKSYLKTEIQVGPTKRILAAELPRQGRKSFQVNGMPIRRLSDLFGLLQVVLFTPDDLQLIKGSPALRRRYLDLQICQINGPYRHYLTRYNQVLKQRNTLLELGDAESLAPWDEQLCTLGSKLIYQRLQSLAYLAPKAQSYHRLISGGQEELQISYQPFWSAPVPSTEEEIHACFWRALQAARPGELRRRQSLIGPQRDDLLFVIDGKDARKYASQGQQRSAVLACKLAELDYMHWESSHYPLLLLDDVASELDVQRRHLFLENISSQVQIYLTTTGIQPFSQEMLSQGLVFQVEKGKISL
jgi:DNA replication and repair protein RecF